MQLLSQPCFFKHYNRLCVISPWVSLPVPPDPVCCFPQAVTQDNPSKSSLKKQASEHVFSVYVATFSSAWCSEGFLKGVLTLVMFDLTKQTWTNAKTTVHTTVLTQKLLLKLCVCLQTDSAVVECHMYQTTAHQIKEPDTTIWGKSNSWE